MLVSTREPRRLYRILRGSYSRREGDAVVIKDDRGVPIKKSVPHRHYRAGTTQNEVMLTDKEAAAFGLSKLSLILGRGVVTESQLPPISPVQEMLAPSTDSSEVADDTDPATRITALIAEGRAATGAMAVNAWRRKVADTELLDEVPKKRDDAIVALEELLVTVNA